MNKQIEEMSEFLWDVQSREDEIEIYNTEALAKRLVDANYRKSTDVASEIFAEIEQEISAAFKSNYKVLPQIIDSDELYHTVQGKISALRGIEGFIAERKKKYESEGADDEQTH